MKQTLKEYCDWLEDLTIAGDTINSKGLQKWITEYAKEQQTKQLPIHDVVGQSKQLVCDNQFINAGTLQGKAMKKCLKCGKYTQAN